MSSDDQYRSVVTQWGREAIARELDGLQKLRDSLDSRFSEAVTLISQVQGRVICTGMGKSGHIARKIAATLSSTGTPSHFVHPGEATHGDLGMITDHDIVIALSASGNTSELAGIIQHSARNGIPLIALTQQENSNLGRHATSVLQIPTAPEACPLGIAPTTSMVLMLAVGDALAVALLNRRGFSSDDFRRLHPGGNLGNKLTRLCEVMHAGENRPLVSTSSTVSDALLEMTRKRLGCVGVVDNQGKLQGIITDGDLRRHLPDLHLSATVTAIMTANPVSLTPDRLVEDAVRTMNGRSISAVFVVDEQNRAQGVVHLHDCISTERR